MSAQWWRKTKDTNYIQKVNANQGARNPWLGPYTIEDGQQQLKLKVKDPADTTGAFQIGAKDFITYWNAKGGTLKYCEIDNGLDENLALGRGHNGEGDKNLQSRRLEQVLNTLENYAQSQSQPLSLIAFFCHGWSNGCQLGVKNNQLSELADCIKRSSREDVVIVLYACSTAESNELSMAAKLRDLLVTPPNAKPYCRVVGHTQVAHSFYTPDIRVFEGTDGIGSQGIDIAAGGSLHQRFKKYVGRNTPCEGFRWAYPLMSINSIHEFLKVDNPPSDAYQMPIN